RPPPKPPLFPYTTLFRSRSREQRHSLTPVCLLCCLIPALSTASALSLGDNKIMHLVPTQDEVVALLRRTGAIREGHFEYPNGLQDRKSTRLNSSHLGISY